jgi:ribosome-associated protein
MEDTLRETDDKSLADAFGRLLQDHKGQDVSVLDLRCINNWTDFFIITTVSSKTHMDGLERHIRDYCRQNDIDIIGSSPKNFSGKFNKNTGDEIEDEWRLIDLGWAIIHLMNKRTREFYELERLWHPIK